MDEIRIWNKSRTREELNEFMDCTLSKEIGLGNHSDKMTCSCILYF